MKLTIIFVIAFITGFIMTAIGFFTGYFLIGTPETITIERNFTINNTIYIQNITQCAVQECPAPVVCPPSKCDLTPLRKCELQSTRYLVELLNCQNITDSFMMNMSNEELQHNLTDCRFQIDAINEILKED